MEDITRSESVSPMEFEQLPLCPDARFKIYFRQYEDEDDDGCVMVGGRRCYQVENSFESGGSSHTVRPLLRCWNKNDITDAYCRNCERRGSDEEDDIYYLCNNGNVIYHKECVESRHEIIQHPYHPKHPLQLLWTFDDAPIPCYFCRRNVGRSFYRCSTCDFAMDPVCANKPALLSIDCPKSHDHPLALFLPRRVSFTCNACGLGNDGCSVYLCLRCDFMIHRDCVYLPFVIKISRHTQHRLSRTYDLPSGDLSCGVCHLVVNNDYGGYSCTKGCSSYVAHAKCATGKHVWDGKELEGVPEDADILRDVEPYEVIGDGIIRHFSHRHHHLRLNEESTVYDESKFCQACVLPIHHDGRFYSCTQCDFILHERCANLPRRLQHHLHRHPLTLQSDNIAGVFKCDACARYCNGFMYKCPEEGSDGFGLDVRCAASISEPYRFEAHPHPLYLSDPAAEHGPCMVCGLNGIDTLKCFEKHCFSSRVCLCFQCATLPYKIKYKHDDHLLTLRHGEEEEANGLYWCEVCEGEVNPEGKFYTCDDCCLSLHVECVFGRDPYFKPGQTVSFQEHESEILPNGRVSRPVCSSCGRRCQYRIVLRFVPYDQDVFCSYICFVKFLYPPRLNCIMKDEI